LKPILFNGGIEAYSYIVKNFIHVAKEGNPTEYFERKRA
jgi:hypothetical protein